MKTQNIETQNIETQNIETQDLETNARINTETLVNRIHQVIAEIKEEFKTTEAIEEIGTDDLSLASYLSDSAREYLEDIFDPEAISPKNRTYYTKQRDYQPRTRWEHIIDKDSQDDRMFSEIMYNLLNTIKITHKKRKYYPTKATFRAWGFIRDYIE